MTTVSTRPQAGGKRASSSVRASGAESLSRFGGGGSRRYGAWAGTVLFIVVVALLAGLAWQKKGHQTDVLAVTKTVPAGATLTSGDVQSVSVSGVSGAVPASQLNSVVGRTLVVGLTPGQIVTNSVLTSHPVPAAGFRVVSVLVAPGRVPVGVSSGDVVEILSAPGSSSGSVPASALNNPQVLASNVTVLGVSSGGASTAAGSGTQVSLLIPAASANQVAEYGAVGQVVVVQAPLGGGN